jgi:hypothetical protein
MAGLSGGVRVEGLNQLVRDLQAMGLEVEDLKEVFGDLSDKGAKTASEYAPKRSGALAGSVRGNKAKNRAVVSAGFGRARRYAAPINYGWPARNIAASGFMQRADEYWQGKAVPLLEEGIERKIREKGLA